MRSRQVHIDSPCHESWDAMPGDAERRFCGVCQTHVHNLSAMRHDDAQALLQSAAGGHLCVRYSAEADGSLRFRDLVPRSRLTRGLVRAAFAASLLAACNSPDAAPIAGLGDSAIEALRGSLAPASSSGCDLSPSPLVTFHLPPGHLLCDMPGASSRSADEPIAATPPQALALAPPQVLAPPPLDAAARAPAYLEDVPCDPAPGFAPPPPRGASPWPGVAPTPPTQRPPEPEHVRMGDYAAPSPPPRNPPRPFPENQPQPFPENTPTRPGFAPPPPSPPSDDMLMGSVSPPPPAMGGISVR